jgi:hypothetical protein
VKVKRRGRTVRRKRCKGRLVSGPVKFTTASKPRRATLSRAGLLYATGLASRAGGGRLRLQLTPLRRIVHGRYTLRLGRGAHAARQQVYLG